MSERESIYKAALLDHYRNPRNRADPAGADVVSRGRNPRCGDDLEIGVDFDGDTVARVRFRGRGCSICIASASMMTEAVGGISRNAARELGAFMEAWFTPGAGIDDAAAPETLRPLSPVRGQSARRRCVMLAWEALSQALDAGEGRRT